METGISVRRGPAGDPGRGARIPGTLKDELRKTLKTEHLSVWELYEGNLEGGLLYWRP